MVVAGMNIEMTVRFKTESDSIKGSADMQGLKDLPLIQINYNPPALNFVLPNPNEKNNAYFEGTVYTDSIAGTFKQAFTREHFF